MSRTLRRVMTVLAVVGLGVASYLTVIHYAGINPACSAGQSCVKVQTSVWSKVGGVPVALLGLIGYVAILGSLLAPDREESRLATLGLTVIGVGFSAYLTYRELFSIHAICEWCVSSAVILTLLLIGAIVRYLTAPPAVVAGSPTAGVYAGNGEPYHGKRPARGQNRESAGAQHDSEDLAAR